MTETYADVVDSYVRALARGDGLPLLPTTRDELREMAADRPEALRLLVDAPPFTVLYEDDRSVRLVAGGETVRAWSADDLKKVRGEWRGRSDGSD